MRRLGILTSGGDAPGMNTALRAVVRSADVSGVETLGIEDGFTGLLQGRAEVLTPRAVGDVLHRGGTLLRTSRCPEMKTPEGLRRAAASLRALDVDGLIVIGGDGSLRGARALAGLGNGVVGIPASIDNDIQGTRMSLGVDSAVNTIMDAIDKLRDTASSHQRAFLIETMGRGSGYLASLAGLIGGAELVVAPESEIDLEEVGEAVLRAYERGKPHCFVIVAEGARMGVQEIARHLEERGIGFESRITTLGHVQRGGSPSAFDRMLASQMGVRAVEALGEGLSGVMTALVGWEIGLVPLDCKETRPGPPEEYSAMARLLAR